ncbi:hypothetical protein [Blastococcus sp. SYSU D00820]
MTPLPPFDGNAYRKRVLAGIEARGGLDATDPFEVYDLPLEAAGTLTDEQVGRQVDAVWAFWQKQRDHPKYRGLVTALLAAHDGLAARLRTPGGRRELAERTRVARARRDAARYAELDAALERLVERFGGVPAGKVAGLRSLAAAAGIDEAGFEARLRRHPRVDDDAPAPAAPGPDADAAVLRQVREGLEELGRLDGVRVPSLHAFLDLPATAPAEVVRRRRDALAALNRRLRPDRRRALVDDLLAAVGALLLDRDPAYYLDSLRDGARETLRPLVAAAVLVEDELTPDDAEHLVGEALAAGLDPARAEALVAELAAEAGAPLPARPSPARPAAGPPGGRPDWRSEVSAGRAALRAGRLRAAERHVAAARAAAGEMQPPIRALQDEVAQAGARAEAAWRRAETALAERRHVAAAGELEELARTAADLPGPGGASVEERLRTARAAVAAADAALAAAGALRGPQRELALLAVVASVADHAATWRELTGIGVAPATGVHVVPAGGGAREVRWTPSTSPGTVVYRVLRVRPDGSRQAVGTTQAAALEDGGSGEVAGYVVVASRAGIAAPEAASGPRPAPGTGPAPAPAAPAGAAVPVLSIRPHGRRLRLVFPPPAEGSTEVRRLPAGAALPAPGSVVPDAGALGALVPAMAPGLAVDARPSAPVTDYVVLTRTDAGTVAGAVASWVVLPAVAGLAVDGDRLRWTWPAGCTEVVVAVRPDAPPEGPDDPAATRRKVTSSRYDIDGGLPLPDAGSAHVAVFACARSAGRLLVAGEAPPEARVRLP